MNFLISIPFFLTSLGGIFNCILVLFKKNRTFTHFLFSVLSFFVACWAFFLGIALMFNDDKNLVFICGRILNYFSLFIPMIYAHFILSFLGENKKRELIVKFCYFINSSILVFSLIFPDSFVPSVSRKWKGMYFVDSGPLYHVFAGLFLVFWLFSAVYLIIKILKSTGEESNQFRYVLFASAFGFIFGLFSYLTVYSTNFSILWSAPVALYPFILAHAFYKHKLMDINLIFSRATTFIIIYSLVIGLPFLMSIFGKDLLFSIFGEYWYYTPLTLIIFLAFLGPYIFIRLDKKIQERIARGQKHFKETIRQASWGIISLRDMGKITRFIVHLLTRTLKIRHLAAYLYDEDKKVYQMFFKRGSFLKVVSDIPQDHFLVNFMKLKMGPIDLAKLIEELKHLQTSASDDVLRLMRELGAQVIVPCYLSNKLLIFFVLGERKDAIDYSKDDIETLDILSKQVSLAIENALSYKQVEETQAQLFQAEKMSTVGTLADGLSHQIKNRFNVMVMIVEYIERLVKNINSFETLDPEKVKQSLRDIEHQLSRIKNNALEASGVVGSLLRYSRSGTAEFEVLDVDDILDRAMEMLSFKMRIEDINLIRVYPKGLPKIKGNITQLQEVFFNLIDNANDAIKERIKILPEQNYMGSIIIDAIVVNGQFLRITVTDNGIGIEKEKQAKIFTPFYTTKNVGQKGTGLGLYVVHKIVVSNHGGKVMVASEYGKSTKFSIELPLA